MSRNNRILEQIRQNPKLVVSDDFEIAVVDLNTKRRSYLNGAIHEEMDRKQTWVTLRLVQRKSPGFASVSGDTKEALQYLIESGSRASDASKVDPWFRFPLWRPQAAQNKYDLLDLTTDEETFALSSRYSILSKKPPGFFEEHEVQTEQVTLFRKQEKHVLSKGRRTFRTTFNLSVQKEAPWYQSEKHSTELAADQSREVLAELLGSALQLSTARTYDGESPTRFVLGPRVISSLLKEHEGAFLAGSQVGPAFAEREISEALTFVDDGTRAGLPESAPFDMEGSLSEKTVLVERGIFKTLLHNTQTATKENRLSTGNYVLSADQKFSRVGFTNFSVEPGTSSDPIEALGDGLFLERIEGVERNNEEGARYWMSGLRVQNGKLVESVRRVPLLLSLSDLLRGARVVGQDLEFFGNTGSPSILFEKKP